MAVIINGEPIADDLMYAEGWFEKARGMIGRKGLSERQAMVFPFASVRRRYIHTVGVLAPLGVIWSVNHQVVRVTVMPPWSVGDAAQADLVVELAPSAVEEISPGAEIRID